VNWVDLVIIAVVVISAVLAFMRGFVREVLGIGAWVGAGFFAAWASPFVRDRFQQWLGGAEYGNPAALAAMFVLALVVLSVVSSMVGGIVRMSLLGGLDRTMGILFGLLRGAVLVAFAYIAGGWVVAVEQWPPPVLQARTLPYAYQAAKLAVALLPDEYRPQLRAPPPGRQAKAEEFMRTTPQGRAVGPP
jgi:membrane protein required for colicin V production